MRIHESLKRNYATIAYYCGLAALVESFILLLPLLLIPFVPEEARYAGLFAIPWALSAAVGIMIILIFRRQEKTTVSLIHASVIIVFVWLWACFIGAFPFYLLGNYTFLHGLFESVSGWTTTGLTVVAVDQVPAIILLWRSIMQYIGGAGLAVIMLTVISSPSASGVYQTEGHTDEIRPQIKQTVLLVMKIYLIYLVFGTLFLTIAGMSFFDALNHGMTALGTGGFSTRPESIGAFNSLPIEIIIIVLMLLGNTNFATHNHIFQKNWKIVLRNVEVRSTFVLILIFVPLTLLLVTIPLYGGNFFDLFNPGLPGWSETYGAAIRRGIFDPISSLTGTGFNISPSFIPWSHLGLFFIALLMSAGGHTNSTAGGFKQLRNYLMLQSFIWYIQEQFFPKSAVTRRYVYKYESRAFIKPEHLREIFNYIFIYMIALVIGTGIIMSYGYPMHGAFFEASSALGTVGLSYGITGYDAPTGILVTEIFLMFFGRLEFFVIFFSIIKIGRDIRSYWEWKRVRRLEARG